MTTPGTGTIQNISIDLETQPMRKKSSDKARVSFTICLT